MTPRWLAIEGLVGAGKTTTAELVGASLEGEVILEGIEQHPFLDDYYSAPDRFALETELAFIAIHMHQIKHAAHGRTLISDFSPAKNPIYGEVSLSPSDATFLWRTDEYLWKDLRRPEVAVFLDVPPATCLERVRIRGRSMEQGLTVGQLERLRSAYISNLGRLAGDVVRLEFTGDESPEEVARAVSPHVDRG
jgi:deoxyadenosine/deoxycytidine kinase